MTGPDGAVRRVVVVNPEWGVETPPRGYGGVSRIAFGFARELHDLGIDVRLHAPRLGDPAAFGLPADRVAEAPPSAAELGSVDAVYLVDARSIDTLCLLGPAELPHVLYVCEDNGFEVAARAGANVRHVVFRADRLPGFAPGTAMLADQVLIREELGPPEAPDGYVLWLGRVHRDKGTEALVSFAEAVPDTPIVVAGPVAEARRWPANVHLVGEVGGEAKRQLLCRADAFLYTVSAWWEGAGEAVLTEAAACGIPLLAQAFGPGTTASRCLVDGANGFVHPDPRRLARLLPLARSLDRAAAWRVASPRFEPRRVARARLAWMDVALARLRGSLGGAAQWSE